MIQFQRQGTFVLPFESIGHSYDAMNWAVGGFSDVNVECRFALVSFRFGRKEFVLFVGGEEYVGRDGIFWVHG